MKKLFFTALVAVAAIGGAYAQEYSTGINGSGDAFDCNGGANPLCSAEQPGGAYVYPTSTFVSSLPDETISYY